MKKPTTIIRYFLFIALFPLIGIAQTQIGGDIDGTTSNSYSGESVSLSADGSIVAIGSRGSSNFRGMVRVFQNVSGVRTQIGNNILGESVGDFSGSSVSLSADGSVVAIGAPTNSGNGYRSGHVRVYKNIAGAWVQEGGDIDGEGIEDRSGRNVSLSSDGNTVAIGAYLNDGNGTDSGHVRVYQNIAGVWQQKGIDIDGLGYSGYSVSLSSDGDTVAIGSPIASTNGSLHGTVKIYRYLLGIWEQIGSNLNGYGAAQSGRSVSLSADGNIVACGAPFFVGANAAHVRVYQNNAGIWQQIGSSINGPAPDIGSGSSVSLSADGNIIAIGNIYGAVNGSNSGQVQVYKNISGIWTQLGLNINGEAIYDQSGVGLSLSGDGTTLAIGAQHNNGNGTNAGHVRIFDLSDVLGTNDVTKTNFIVYPNPVSNYLAIETHFTGSSQLIVINNLGQLVLKQNQNTSSISLDVSNLSKGLYFLNIASEDSNSQTIKFIKN